MGTPRHILVALAITAGCHRVAAHPRDVDLRDTSRVVGTYSVTRGPDSVAQVRLVEVTYGPSGVSPPHSHSCPVIGYIVEGALRSRVDDEPERVYHIGETFYERANSRHVVSANANERSGTKLLAVFVCPH